jgi:hypothetical protein
MEYGIWISKRGNFNTLKECRHHGLQEFGFYINKTRVNWQCLKCQRQQKKGIYTSKIAGCSNTVGLIIAENVLSKAFKIIIKAHPMEPYDFICGNNLKVDSKCATLSIHHRKQRSYWQFNINKNKVTDVFCLIALDNLPNVRPEDAKPIHVWVISGNAIIDGRPLNDRMGLSVSPKTLARLEPWRRMDMEGRITKCCDKLKREE